MPVIPGFQDIMLPLIAVLHDGQIRRIAELVDQLADELRLTESEHSEMLPSGKQARFSNRVHWAGSYLVKAGVFERPGRGQLKITDRGRAILTQNLQRVDLSYLMQFPEIQEFRTRRTEFVKPTVIDEGAVETPEESLESSYLTLRNELASDLLDRLAHGTPRFFEKTVVDLLVTMGYGGSRASVAQAVGKSGDDGIDGVINEDKLGLDVVYIQAKRWTNPVGRPTVQAFTGSLEGQRARKGVLITTSSFTRDAREFVERIEKRIVLIDGEELADHMIDHDVGVTSAATYVVKKIDGDYFEEE